jgi:hypothetical protein
MFIYEALMLIGGALIVAMSIAACTTRRSVNPFSAY